MSEVNCGLKRGFGADKVQALSVVEKFTQSLLYRVISVKVLGFGKSKKTLSGACKRVTT